MKIKTLFAGVYIISLLGCYDSNIPTPIPTLSINNATFSRSTIEAESLPNGATVLFHAEGALNTNNLLLTYSKDRWESASPIQWSNNTGITTYNALYPVYDDYSYSSTNLYATGCLEDILIAKDTLLKKQDIKLRFNHLFSQINIQVTPSIQEQIKGIHLTVPTTINNISIETGTFSTIPALHTTTLSKNNSGNYSFIIPPMKECTLTLGFEIDTTIYKYQLPTHTFESNKKYDCNLRTSAGIQNAKDLIEFSMFINKKGNLSENSLDKFGEKHGNDTIFYLLNDIELTEEDCKELLPIGYNAIYGFNHIFEGNGHTISNLIIPDKSNNSSVQSLYSGLFGNITEKGVIRNLTIINSHSADNPTCKQTGILSAENNGTIINCFVSNSSITAGNNSTSLGLICANNAGYIINCGVENNAIKTGSNVKSGGIAGNATGYILNCYAYNNSFTTKNGSYTGGIAGMSNINIPLTIANCCVYHSKTYNYFGAIIGNLRGGTIDYAYYNNNKTYYSISASTVSNSYLYQSDFSINGISLPTYLNTWVDSIGKELYPEIIFKKWAIESNISPRFE